MPVDVLDWDEKKRPTVGLWITKRSYKELTSGKAISPNPFIFLPQITLDTGFSGELCLPRQYCEEKEFDIVDQDASFATVTNSNESGWHYTACVIFKAQLHPVIILSPNSKACNSYLIGSKLLKDLCIDLLNSGPNLKFSIPCPIPVSPPSAPSIASASPVSLPTTE